MNVKQKMGIAFGVMAMALVPSALMAQNEWKLVWSDEFNTDGLLDSKVWNYEEAMVSESQCLLQGWQSRDRGTQGEEVSQESRFPEGQQPMAREHRKDTI